MAGPLPAPRGADDDGVLHAVIGQVSAVEPAQHPPAYRRPWDRSAWRAGHPRRPPRRRRRTPAGCGGNGGRPRSPCRPGSAPPARPQRLAMSKALRIAPGIVRVPPQDRPRRIDPHGPDIDQAAAEFMRVVEGRRRPAGSRSRARPASARPASGRTTRERLDRVTAGSYRPGKRVRIRPRPSLRLRRSMAALRAGAG